MRPHRIPLHVRQRRREITDLAVGVVCIVVACGALLYFVTHRTPGVCMAPVVTEIRELR